MEQNKYFMIRDTEGNLPIHLAFIHHIPECIDFMLQSPNITSFLNSANSSDLNTPLHLAIMYGDYEHAVQLLNLDADVNAENNMGFTPCHTLVKYARGDYPSDSEEVMSSEQIMQLCEKEDKTLIII